MTELEKVMSNAADLIENEIANNDEARANLLALRQKDQEPALVRNISPNTVLLIRFQDVPT